MVQGNVFFRGAANEIFKKLHLQHPEKRHLQIKKRDKGLAMRNGAKVVISKKDLKDW
ncbi:MAG: hypothetical protein L6Q97_12880 [Thermoanaerobaculia bacterium]|nr:hypothetical protein [Thermoanaerobaculia bacterium]